MSEREDYVDLLRAKIKAVTKSRDEIKALLHAEMCKRVDAELDRDMAEAERIDLAKQLRSEIDRHAACQNERDQLADAVRYHRQSSQTPTSICQLQTANSQL